MRLAAAIFAEKMLNRKLTIGVLFALNAGADGYVAMRYGLAAINNWLLIVSLGLLSWAIYRVLGMVEGYSDERKIQ